MTLPPTGLPAGPTPLPAPNPYPATSRHHGLPTAVHIRPDGRAVSYLARRVLTDPDRLYTRHTLELTDGDRLDTVAASAHGDPLAWWLLVEAEPVDHPDEVVAQPGRRIRIVMPPQVLGDQPGGGG